IQHEQPEFSRKVPRDLGKTSNDKPNPLQEARQKENKNLRRRIYRDVITELESSRNEKTLTTSRNDEEIENVAQNRHRYSVIYKDKIKDVFREINNENRKIDALFEGSGSGTTETPTDTTTVRFTVTNDSTTEGDIDTTLATSTGPYTTSKVSTETASQTMSHP
ncbi:Hypothetical predicted protein, partial [Pelobates cultripes]